MSRKNLNKVQRRSALSFAGANGSLDIDHVLESEPWKNIKIFEQSEAARIQSVLNDFDNKIMQEKTLKASAVVQKNSKSTEKSATATPTKDLTSVQKTIVIPKTTVKKGEKKEKNTKQVSKTMKEITPQESSGCSVDNAKTAAQKSLPPNENIVSGSIGKKRKKTNLQNVTNMTETNLQTSTPKQEASIKTARKSVLKKNTSRMKTKTNLNEDVKCKENETSKKNAGDSKHCQSESNAKISNKVRKNNLKTKKLGNTVEKSVKTESCKETLECNVDKECSSKLNGSEEKNLKKENSTNKPLKRIKSSRPDNAKNAKCGQKECAKSLGESESLKVKEHTEKSKERTKSKKAAKAIHELSRDIEIVKRKMQCIRNDLESNESSDFSSTESSYSSYSSYSSDYSSDYSDSSYTSRSCSCHYKSDDYTEYTLNSH